MMALLLLDCTGHVYVQCIHFDKGESESSSPQQERKSQGEDPASLLNKSGEASNRVILMCQEVPSDPQY